MRGELQAGHPQAAPFAALVEFLLQASSIKLLVGGWDLILLLLGGGRGGWVGEIKEPRGKGLVWSSL